MICTWWAQWKERWEAMRLGQKEQVIGMCPWQLNLALIPSFIPLCRLSSGHDVNSSFLPWTSYTYSTDGLQFMGTRTDKTLFGHDPKLKSCIQDALKTQKDERSSDHHSAPSSKLLLSWREGRANGYGLCSASSLSSWQLALQSAWVCRKTHEHRLQSTCYPEVTAHCCLYQLTWQPSLQCLEAPAPACFLKQASWESLVVFLWWPGYLP